MRKELYYSILFEVSAVTNLIFMKSAYQLFLTLILHLIACILIVNVLTFLLPKRYKKDRTRVIGAFISLTLLGFFLFLLGYISLTVLTVYLLRNQKTIVETNIKSYSLDELFLDKMPARVNLFGEAPLYFAIFRENIPKSRLDLVSLIISEAKNPKLIEYASRFISSDNDELRLSAASLYYKLENSIQERIKHLLEKLRSEKSKEEEAYTLYELAKSYYDLIYYKLVDKELEAITLKKAEEYLKKAISIKETPEFYIFLGKIYIAKKEYPNAIEALHKVSQYKHINPISYVPYIAEAYFGSGNFLEVKNVIERYSKSLRYTINPYLVYLIDFWERKHGPNRKQG